MIATGPFCTHAPVRRVQRPASIVGPLAGLSFAAKDVFQVAGERACYGNPTWLATHPPATVTADAVSRLLDAGAVLEGMTVTDELALSLTGENAHYGTPANPRCPDRVPGGSSSGSAAAVAGGLVDVALGTDTGGSVRVPASHTGLYGLRPTWGAVSTSGVLPLAPRFDTVGWFARDAALLARVGGALLPPREGARRPRRLRGLLAAESVMDAGAWQTFRGAATRLAEALVLPLEWVPAPAASEVPPLATWAATYLPLQNRELVDTHRGFLERERPVFGPLIKGRIDGALKVSGEEAAAAEGARSLIVGHLATLLGDDAWVVLPSAAGVAPLRGQDDATLNAVTFRSLSLAAAASLGGLPQLTLPLAECDGCPLGVSLLGPAGGDVALLDAAVRASTALNENPLRGLR